jgi:DNA/RNA-binding domain of Phe-tRNA-synthetase-like protein
MARRFVIEPTITELFPALEIGVLIVRGINNRKLAEVNYDDLLAEGVKESRRHLANPEFASNSVIATWREAFKRFKIKKGARSSIEALLKRIANGNPVGSINPLVDLYNFISMKYAIPCGGETLKAIQGDLILTVAAGGESFLPLGAEVDDPALPGEVIYKDDGGAVCRCFNWREAQRTMLTEETTDAILVMEQVDGTRLEAALTELRNLVQTHLGGRSELHVMNGAGWIEMAPNSCASADDLGS